MSKKKAVKRKIWLVRTVPLGKKSPEGLEEYARKYEQELNKLEDDGYNITQMWREDRGQVIIGRLQETAIEVLSRLGASSIPIRVVPERNVGTSLSGEFSERLFNAVLNELDPTASDEVQDEVVKTAIRQVMAQAPANEVQKTMADCDAIIKDHSCGDQQPCDYLRAFNRVRTALDARLQISLS